jgi:hypothetical protein
MPKLVVIAALVMLSSSCSDTHETAKPIEVTLCEVAANPSRFGGRLVRIRAQIESDGREHTRLSDRRCQSTWIAVASRPAPEADLREIKSVLFGKESGTLDREVTATCVGRIHSRTVGKPRHAIELASVSEISVKRIRRDSGKRTSDSDHP